MKNLIFLLLIFPLAALAVPEEEFQRAWIEKIFPHFVQMQTGEIENAQGLSLKFHYSVKSSASKTIVILPGRTEPAVKYAEVIYDLDRPDLNIFVFDHQGQGESDRILKESDKGHVENFQNYIDDLSLFMKKVVLKLTPNTEHLLLAHSMGGGIGTLYLAQNPGVFKKAVLNAPMLKLNTKPYPELVAKLYAVFLMKRGKATDYAPGQKPYSHETNTFEANVATHSEVRFTMARDLFVDYPDLIVGGASVQWVNASLKATGRSQNLAPKIPIPLLMFQAGHDEYVKTDRQTSFCKKAPDCHRVFYPQAFHEILMEKDEIRNDAITKIKSFFGI